jgi:hypothetical protein
VADQMSTNDQGMQQRASELADAARSQGQGVVDDARHEASAVMSEAGTQAQNLLDQAVSSVRHQAEDGAGRAAGALGGLGERLQALGHGDVDGAGDIGRYATDIGERLSSAANRLGDRGVDGLMQDVQRFGRRRPGLFLAAAAVSGFAAGRLVRGARAESASSNGSSTSPDDGSRQLASAGAPSTLPPGPMPAGGSAAEYTGPATSTSTGYPGEPQTPASTGYPAEPSTPTSTGYPEEPEMPSMPVPPAPGTLPGDPGGGPR